MTIEVLIQREASGRLRAWVLQNGRGGRNILAGRSIHDVGKARSIISQRLFREVSDWAELEIKWTVKA